MLKLLRAWLITLVASLVAVVFAPCNVRPSIKFLPVIVLNALRVAMLAL